MTKASLVVFTCALAKEQGERSERVNAVAPGPIGVTPVLPLAENDKQRRFGENAPARPPRPVR
ncbi:hypothetical protein [Pseudoclavibacter sp. CFCC 13611]|uniref:hypothetical protein n=1 Tax=Pseudoclavibacter sp. CFCC 13611 TaxID=2615178 RepID=UPI0021F0D3C2|nr:hypothetical protein [Pseudoclavibacter sp. CFCC 13611]